jgi:hypothetical protein
MQQDLQQEPTRLLIHYTDGNGCTASDDAVVTVNALPVVTADDNSVCTGSSVAVSGSPAGARGVAVI